jgi:hypothetical protein
MTDYTITKQQEKKVRDLAREIRKSWGSRPTDLVALINIADKSKVEWFDVLEILGLEVRAKSDGWSNKVKLV